jgi:enoyl-CoA hydratase
MVNQVYKRAELAEATLTLAKKIAQKPAFALKTTKEAINQTQDAMGRHSAMLQAFSLHQLCHAHNMQMFGIPVDPAGLPETVREKFKQRGR